MSKLTNSYNHLLNICDSHNCKYSLFDPRSWKALKDDFNIDVKRELSYKFREFVLERPAFELDGDGSNFNVVRKAFLETYVDTLHTRIIKAYIKKYTSYNADPNVLYWQIFGERLDVLKNKITLDCDYNMAKNVFMIWRKNINIPVSFADKQDEILRYEQCEYSDNLRDDIMNNKIYRLNI